MRRIHWTWPAAALCLVGVIVTGCALLQPAAPTTTVTDASGQQVTLSWADYPGYESIEPADVLAAPRAEQVEQAGDALLADLQRAIDEVAPGLDWRIGAEGGVYESGGNGYGGDSLHRVYNSDDTGAAAVPDDWPALTAAIDAELAAHGFEPIVWDFDRAPYPGQSAAEHDAEVVQVHGSLDPDEMWAWYGGSTNGSQWVWVGLVDVDRGVGAPADADVPAPQQLSLMVGATVVSAADEQAYRAGVAPFEGLEQPPATHSD